MASSKCDTNFVKDFLNKREVNLAGWIIAIIAIVFVIIALISSTVTLFKDKDDGYYTPDWYNFLITVNIVFIVALAGVVLWIIFFKIIKKKDTEGDKIALLTTKIAEITADKITDPIADEAKRVIDANITINIDNIRNEVLNRVCGRLRDTFSKEIIPLTDRDVALSYDDKIRKLEMFNIALGSAIDDSITETRNLIGKESVKEALRNSATQIKEILKKEVEDAYNSDELALWISTGVIKNRKLVTRADALRFAGLDDTFYTGLTPSVALSIKPQDAFNIPAEKINLIPIPVINSLSPEVARILKSKLGVDIPHFSALQARSI